MKAILPASPRMRYLLLASVLVVFFCSYYFSGAHSAAVQALPPSWKTAFGPPAHSPVVELLPDQLITSEEDATTYCANYRLKPFDASRRPQRKVYDLLLINTELELLEIRMGQMSPYVDYFVILESDRTFTDRVKPLYVRENWDRFKPWHSKMILRTMDLSEFSGKDTKTWDRERGSRDAMFTQIVPNLSGTQAANEDDVLLVSDVDEIPKPAPLKALRNCNFPPRTTLHGRIYYYSYQWLARNDWNHPQATVYKGPDQTIKPEDLRGNGRDLEIRHASWHCSYCLPTIEEMVKKVTSFSHSEFDKPEFKDPEKILQRVRTGTDFFDRKSSLYDRVENNPDVPDYLKQNAERYKFMLDRDPPNANFQDYMVPLEKEKEKKN